MYIDKKDLYNQIMISKNKDELTSEAVDMFIKMTKECSRILKYKNKEDKEDCMSEAMCDLLRYWRNFDPNIPNSNIFAYYTQIIKNGLSKGYKKLNPIKTTNLISINDDYII